MKNVLLVCILFATACSNNDKPKPVDEWKLTEKSIYRTVLNEVGKPDTVYVTTYKLANSQATDSVQQIWTYTYPDNNDLIKTLLEKKADGTYKVLSREDQIADANFQKMRTVVRNDKGEIIREQSMVYDTARRPISLQEITVGLGNGNLKRYDTLNMQYVHDETGRVVTATAKNGRGEVVRKDINIYSGPNPLQSIVLGASGDTLRKTSFSIENGVIVSNYDTDSLSFKTWSKDGYLIGQIATAKYSPMKYRKVVSYDNNRMSAEFLYESGK